MTKANVIQLGRLVRIEEISGCCHVRCYSPETRTVKLPAVGGGAFCAAIVVTALLEGLERIVQRAEKRRGIGRALAASGVVVAVESLVPAPMRHAAVAE
jgi:hypothetical protein